MAGIIRRFEAIDPPLGTAGEEFSRLHNQLKTLISPRVDYNDSGSLEITIAIPAMPVFQCVLEFFHRTLPFDPSHPNHQAYVRALTAHAQANRFGMEFVLSQVSCSLELWASHCVSSFENDLTEGRIPDSVTLALARRAVEARGIGNTGAEHNPGFISEWSDGDSGLKGKAEHWSIPPDLRELWKWPTVNVPDGENSSETLEVQLPLVDTSKGPTAVKFPDSFGRALYKAAGCQLPVGVRKTGPLKSVDPIARVIGFEKSDEDSIPEALERSIEVDVKKARSLLRKRRDYILEKAGWKLEK